MRLVDWYWRDICQATDWRGRGAGKLDFWFSGELERWGSIPEFQHSVRHADRRSGCWQVLSIFVQNWLDNHALDPYTVRAVEVSFFVVKEDNRQVSNTTFLSRLTTCRSVPIRKCEPTKTLAAQQLVFVSHTCL